jgi:hypothetical protein
MRIRLSTCAFLVGLLAAAVPARAQFNVPAPPPPGEDYRVEIGAMFWKPSPELTIRSNDLGLIGNEIDFVQEFGIEDKRFREFRVTLKPGRKHKLRLHYLPIKYEQEATIQRQIVFAGQVFNVGIPATATVDWKFWRFGYEWDFISRSSGFLGLVTELKYNQVRGEIGTPIANLDATAEQTAPVPAIGLVGRGYLSKNVSITGEFTGFKLPDAFIEEFDGAFWDFDIYGTVNLGRNAAVQAGYRSLDVDYIADEDLGRLKMKGIYFGGLVRF